ncbi:MAG: DUF1572 family protein [Acidobacteria bacterium]|nr:DUF1572 family protein [Acidobacteriota bacterium]MBV9474585.1 DUF1572 family protein [Acidobacteriota bacterium]
MTDTLQTLIDALRTRVTRVFPEQIHAAVAGLTDEQLWWRPNESSNSIGNLLLHLTGSLNLYLNRNIGGFPFTRDRAAEFAERRALPKKDVLAMFDEMVASAVRTFDALTPARLSEPSPEPAMHDLVIEDVVNVLSHLSTHVGQIVWIAKMLDAGGVHEVWMKAHRHGGAWKP